MKRKVLKMKQEKAARSSILENGFGLGLEVSASSGEANDAWLEFGPDIFGVIERRILTRGMIRVLRARRKGKGRERASRSRTKGCLCTCGDRTQLERGTRRDVIDKEREYRDSS